MTKRFSTEWGSREPLHAETLVRLEAQYRDADELLLVLASMAARRDPVSVWDRLTKMERLATDRAMHSALRRVTAWAPQPICEMELLARFAIVDAVAALELRALVPALADELATGWEIGSQVRDQLRQMGPQAESVARLLLPHWRLPLPGLPMAVLGLWTDNPGARRGDERTAPGGAG